MIPNRSEKLYVKDNYYSELIDKQKIRHDRRHSNIDLRSKRYDGTNEAQSI